MSTPGIPSLPDAPLQTSAPMQPFANWQELPARTLINRIAEAGIIGMGGGGYPTAEKLQLASTNHAYRVVANAVECEPGISCDAALLAQHEPQILLGLRIVARCLAITADQPVELHLAIGGGSAAHNRPPRSPDAIEPEPTRHYVPKTPGAGAERQLCKTLFDLTIGAYEHPVDQQILVLNVATVFAIAQAVIAGKPLTERVVTVNGSNYWVTLQHPISEIIPGPSRTGGFWTGQPNALDARVTGATNALWPHPLSCVGQENKQLPTAGLSPDNNAGDNHWTTAFQTAARLAKQPPTGCINCGLCRTHCPVDLAPDLLHRAHTQKQQRGTSTVAIEAVLPTADLCIECGKCDQVCPSAIPLLHSFREAKLERGTAAQVEQQAERAKARFARHQTRLTRRAQAKHQKREARLATKRDW